MNIHLHRKILKIQGNFFFSHTGSGWTVELLQEVKEARTQVDAIGDLTLLHIYQDNPDITNYKNLEGTLNLVCQNLIIRG